MTENKLPYLFYMVLTGLLAFGIIITPFLAFDNNPISDVLYDGVFTHICHQKISRSHCLFNGEQGYYLSDCLPQNGEYRADLKSEKTAFNNGDLGYKFPVSARDMPFYIAMFIGGIALFYMGKSYSKEIPPAIWLVLAIIPMGIDGTTQTILQMRESTNFLRLITGFIAGFVLPFYLVPMLNKIFGKKGKKRTK